MAADGGGLPAPTAPVATDADLEKADRAAASLSSPPAAASSAAAGDGGSTVVSAVVDRWRRENLLERGGLVLRGLVLIFSLLALLILALNKHGELKDFDLYQEYRYLLGVSIIAFLYSAAQVGSKLHRFSTGRNLMSLNHPWIIIIDFAGDQVITYLLISGLSAAIPLTNRMREGADNIFTDSLCASISMAFLAFASSALSALISGFKLSNQTYV